ncbi:HlyC/CorC family transporter [Aminipila butyrica]|uniref:HlyC/CorC family transporter n=1 Tax=Aminipila butyrica TaxID=433296 RepID=A0A858BWI9_9FIRM|nr:hemolysin family protein [Aminipila butyrica]QIB69468.1 HlyC/CorC family transporter [Aminipila butyrica]
MVYLLNIIIIIFLVYFNAFFVATEFAMVKVRRSRIETLVREGNNKAKHTLTVVDNLNAYLSACQLGITLASLGLGWVGEPAVAKMLEPFFEWLNISGAMVHSISFIIGFSLITAVHIVLGELVPKSLAIISAEKLALYTALPLILFYRATYPIMWAFNHTTNFILKIFGLSQANEHEEAHTDQEIKLLVEESYKHGLVDKTEMALIDNIFDFSEKTVTHVMIPRTDMECIFLEDPLEEILAYVLDKQRTRYPVCRKDKDHVVGFLHAKDLYKQELIGSSHQIDSIIRDVQFVPESMSISQLLKIFKLKKTQLAVIVDEYGGTSGLVTLEDILEEIVGDLQDEFNVEMPEIINQEDGSYIVDGKVHLEELEELLGLSLEDDNVDTLGGWIYSRLEANPKAGDEISYEGYKFVIYSCDQRRIRQVHIEALSPSQTSTDSE